MKTKQIMEEFERKWISEMGEHCPLTIANVSIFFSNHNSENMEEIYRLARLCEAKDAEYNELDRHYADELADGRKLRAMIAMQAWALKTCTDSDTSMYQSHNPILVKAALSSTSETVAAYELEVKAKALEELLDEADDSNWRNAAYSRIEELRASKGE